jgi:anti-sigma factor RsiW
MNCNEVRENLIVLLAEGHSDPAVTAHVRDCSACAQEMESFRKTMALMDEWEAPEPSPYFLTRLRAHVKDEKEKAPVSAGVFAWLRRPAMAVSMAAVLAAGALIYRLSLPPEPPRAPEPGTPVADVEALERNHDVLMTTDLIEEMTGGPSDDVLEE